MNVVNLVDLVILDDLVNLVSLVILVNYLLITWGVGWHYGLTGRPIKNLKMPKKVRQGGQNLGKITRKLELETFFASNGKLFFSK